MRALVVVEAAITTAEVVLRARARRSRSRRMSLQHAGDVRQVAVFIGALMVLGWVRAADCVRPIVAARNAKAGGPRAGRGRDRRDRAGRPARAVRDRVHPLAALVGGGDLPAVHLASRALLAWPSAIGLACITFLHAGGAAAARGRAVGA